MTTTETTRTTYQLAREHGIEPARCQRQIVHCYPPSFEIRSDDDGDVLYQCSECGNMQHLSRGHVLRLIRENDAAS